MEPLKSNKHWGGGGGGLLEEIRYIIRQKNPEIQLTNLLVILACCNCQEKITPGTRTKHRTAAAAYCYHLSTHVGYSAAIHAGVTRKKDIL